MKAAAITAPPKTNMPRAGGTGAPLSRTSTPGSVHAAMMASLTCHTGREVSVSPIVFVPADFVRAVARAGDAPGRGRVRASGRLRGRRSRRGPGRPTGAGARLVSATAGNGPPHRHGGSERLED